VSGLSEGKKIRGRKEARTTEIKMKDADSQRLYK
jgi:hypothetical protein